MTPLHNFGTELAYAVEAAVKRANRDANCDYSDALGFGSPFQQDEAFAACQRTGRLADEAGDAVIECEDALWTRGIAETFANPGTVVPMKKGEAA